MHVWIQKKQQRQQHLPQLLQLFGLLLPQVSRVIPKGYPHNG